MYFPGHYGITLEETIRALRVGEQGWANEGLSALLDYLVRLLPLAGDGVSPEALLWLPQELEQAQRRRDFIRLADLIEYELPHSPLPALFPLSRAHLRATPKERQRPGGEVEIRVDTAPKGLPLEFAFTLLDRALPPGREPETVRPFSTNPTWRWRCPPEPGRFRLGVYLRPKGSAVDFVAGERIDYRVDR